MANMRTLWDGTVPYSAILDAVVEELEQNKSIQLKIEREGPFHSYYLSGNIKDTYFNQQLYLECKHLVNKRIKVGPSYSLEFTRHQILKDQAVTVLGILGLSYELKLK